MLAAGLILLAAGFSGLTPRMSLAPRGSSNVLGVLRRRAVLAPLLSMVCAQVVMVGVMTMTPLQLHDHGHGSASSAWCWPPT